MKKLLIVSLNSCYPLYHGGALAQYYFLDGLKEQVEFVFCTIVSTEKELENIEIFKKKQPFIKVYFVDERLPNVKETLKSKINQQLFKLYRILFPKEINPDDSTIEFDDFRDPYFLTVDKQRNPSFVGLINDVIEKENIQQVQFEFYDTMDYCFAVPSTIRKIFIHHELRFKRLKLAAKSSNLPELYKNYLIDKTEAYERMCVGQMDEVVVFNKDDAQLLVANSKHLTVSPFAVPDELIFKQTEREVFKQYYLLVVKNILQIS